MKLFSFVILLFLLLVFLWIQQPWIAIIIGLLIILYALTSLSVKAGRAVGKSAKKHGSQIYADLDKASPKAPDAMKTIDSSMKEIGKKFGDAIVQNKDYRTPDSSFKSPNKKLRIAKGLSNFVEGMKKLFKK
ncbi:MAG: hypothetical protein Q7S21_03790 [archaeon]|nr:hypothetical protein [archaeon]